MSVTFMYNQNTCMLFLSLASGLFHVFHSPSFAQTQNLLSQNGERLNTLSRSPRISFSVTLCYSHRWLNLRPTKIFQQYSDIAEVLICFKHNIIHRLGMKVAITLWKEMKKNLSERYIRYNVKIEPCWCLGNKSIIRPFSSILLDSWLLFNPLNP